MTSERRTWDTPTRQPWNAPIHHCLRAIDNHTALFLSTGDKWHEEQAAFLRAYVHRLKMWIHATEAHEKRAAMPLSEESTCANYAQQ